MEKISSLLITIILLGVLVIAHEFGHFIIAKKKDVYKRQVLDRVVGYTISDLLWKKVKKGLSGGRVQSVALRLICDREGEIREFIPEEYWTLGAKLKDADGKGFEAKFYGKMCIRDRQKGIFFAETLEEIKDILGK